MDQVEADAVDRPDRDAARVDIMFREILESKGIHAFVRQPRGRDILAACGQLAARGVNPAQTVSDSAPAKVESLAI